MRERPFPIEEGNPSRGKMRPHAAAYQGALNERPNYIGEFIAPMPRSLNEAMQSRVKLTGYLTKDSVGSGDTVSFLILRCVLSPLIFGVRWKRENSRKLSFMAVFRVPH
jgi:hypothetical protein